MSRPAIIACLAWFDEPLPFLQRIVRTLAETGIADKLVAIDGAWQGFPHDDPRSPAEQHFALNAACEDHNLPHDLVSVDRAFDSQVHKRDTLMQHATTQGDWLIVVDGDDWIDHANADNVRNILADAWQDVATVYAHNTIGSPGVNIPRPIRRIYRATCGIHVSTAHNGYCTDDGRWLHGDAAYKTLEPVVPIPQADLLINHDRLSRGESRNGRAMQYRKHRNEHRTEAWRPHQRTAHAY